MGLYTSQNILDEDEPKLYQEAISEHNTNLWHAHWYNYTCDVSSTSSKIEDSK
jgi:hypothetical protein